MKFDDFSEYFDEIILRRGYNYYKENRVKDIRKYKNKYTATVLGTIPYKVTIKTNKNNNVNMTCNCPYAEDNYCKHMAALLYCIKKGIKFDNPNNENKSTNNDIITKYKLDYYRKFKNEYTDVSVIEYEKLLDKYINIGLKYINVDNDIAYNLFIFLLKEINIIYFDDVMMLKHGNYEFNDYLYNKFYELLKINNYYDNLLNYIYNCFIDKNNIEYCLVKRIDLLNSVFNNIKNKDEACKLIKLIYDIKEDNKNKDELNNINCNIIKLKYNYFNSNDALSMAYQNLDNCLVCNFLLEITTDFHKKVELLKKIIDVNNNKYYFNMLKKTYYEYDKNLYIEFLENTLKDKKEYEIYIEIKEFYPKNKWNTIRNKYIKLFKDSYIYYEILLDEKMYNEYIKELDNKILDLDDLTYKILVKYKSRELLKYIKKALYKYIKDSINNLDMKMIILNLKRISKLPHGKKEINIIIEYIKDKYKYAFKIINDLEFYVDTYL